MNLVKLLVPLLCAGSSVAAQAQAGTWRVRPPADLRSLLKQSGVQDGVSGAAQPAPVQPRRLSMEERAVLRRQLSAPATAPRREARRP